MTYVCDINNKKGVSLDGSPPCDFLLLFRDHKIERRLSPYDVRE
jgi:hypothetical protein